jgi:hypothetical protein
MSDLKLFSTSTTPSVSLCENGNLEIIGKVIPDADIDFWSPIRSWFDNYLKSPSKHTIFRLRLECLNTSSSKEILQLLYRLNELKELGFFATIEWNYVEGDFDMLEVGHDYELMVKIPFVFSLVIEGSVV